MNLSAHIKSDLRHIAHVVSYRALAELRSEGSRTYAGYLWWIFQPLLMFGVYYIAFNFVMSNRTENFAIFLFTGIVLWQWFSVSVLRCSGSLISARALMQQVNLHKSVFPFSIVMVNTVKFCVTLFILFIVLQLAGFHPGAAWITLPILLLIELIVILAYGCFAAMISPFMPDFQNILSTILHLMFFVSGIIYDLSIMPDRVQAILKFNPMAILIRETRTVLMYNQMPHWSTLIIPVIQAFVVLSISLLLIHRFDKVYPKIG
jgi:homopolymeric O-antigen transport system permease protein